MNNPYQPPESDVSNKNDIIKSKLGWKIFFWFILIIELLSVSAALFDHEENIVELAAETLLYSAILFGLFGFSYNKKFFIRKFWGYLIPTGLFWDIYTLSTIGWTEIETTEELYFSVGLLIVIGLPLLILQYTALFKYSFRSPEIWS
jgi:hypothetical protein